MTSLLGSTQIAGNELATILERVAEAAANADGVANAVEQASLIAISELLNLSLCRRWDRSSVEPTTHESEICYLIQDAFDPRDFATGQIQFKPPHRSNLTWSSANSWNCYAQSSYHSRGLASTIADLDAFLSVFKKSASRSTMSRNWVEEVALWAHLIPFEENWGEIYPRSNSYIADLLKRQHADGLAYPVAGGGSCPDFNYAVVLSNLYAIEGCPPGIDVLVRKSLESMYAGLIYYLRLASFPIRESFRDRSPPLYVRFFLPRKIRYWTSSRGYQQLLLSQPSWFCSLMRVLTLLVLSLSLGYGAPRIQGKSTNQRKPAVFNHLACTLWNLLDKAI